MTFVRIFLFLMAFAYGVAIIQLIVGLLQWKFGGEESRERIRELMGWTNNDSAQKSQRNQGIEVDYDYQRALRELNREFPGTIEGES